MISPRSAAYASRSTISLILCSEVGKFEELSKGVIYKLISLGVQKWEANPCSIIGIKSWIECPISRKK